MTSVLFICLCIIWSTTWMGIKIGLDYFPPFIFAGIRFAIAAVFLFVLLKIEKKRTVFKMGKDFSSGCIWCFKRNCVWIGLLGGTVYFFRACFDFEFCASLFQCSDCIFFSERTLKSS